MSILDPHRQFETPELLDRAKLGAVAVLGRCFG